MMMNTSLVGGAFPMSAFVSSLRDFQGLGVCRVLSFTTGLPPDLPPFFLCCSFYSGPPRWSPPDSFFIMPPVFSSFVKPWRGSATPSLSPPIQYPIVTEKCSFFFPGEVVFSCSFPLTHSDLRPVPEVSSKMPDLHAVSPADPFSALLSLLAMRVSFSPPLLGNTFLDSSMPHCGHP